jgi:hypothetical protein
MRHTHRLHSSGESADGTCTIDMPVGSGRPVGTEGAIKNDHGAGEAFRIPAPNLRNQRSIAKALGLRNTLTKAAPLVLLVRLR